MEARGGVVRGDDQDMARDNGAEVDEGARQKGFVEDEVGIDKERTKRLTDHEAVGN